MNKPENWLVFSSRYVHLINQEFLEPPELQIISAHVFINWLKEVYKEYPFLSYKADEEDEDGGFSIISTLPPRSLEIAKVFNDFARWYISDK